MPPRDLNARFCAVGARTTTPRPPPRRAGQAGAWVPAGATGPLRGRWLRGRSAHRTARSGAGRLATGSDAGPLRGRSASLLARGARALGRCLLGRCLLGGGLAGGLLGRSLGALLGELLDRHRL